LGLRIVPILVKSRNPQVGSRLRLEGPRQALVRRERGFATERKEKQKGTKKQAFG
jgi:hypothetical protein